MYRRLKETAVEVVKHQYNLAYAELDCTMILRTYSAIREDNFLFRRWDDVGTVSTNWVSCLADFDHGTAVSSGNTRFDIQPFSKPSA